jgi:hypothetical protein
MSWEVQLIGDPIDLRMLADTCTSAECQIIQSGNEYMLRAAQFELLDSAASVRECAIKLVTVLSSSARLILSTRQGISVGPTVYWTRPDGKRDTTVLVGTAVCHVRAMPITVVHGTQILRPADPILQWLSLAQQFPAVAKVMRLRDAGDLDWRDLYPLYEVIQDDVGGAIQQLGWATGNELKHFERTANNPAAAGDKARHGVEKYKPPRKPMSLAHARELIDRIMRAWLEWKASHHGQASRS